MSRPILPNVSPTQPDTSGLLSPIAGGSASVSSSSSKTTYAKRGKITIVACVPCRKRKTKCDGKRPRCGQCSSRDSECQYDMTSDQRRLTYLRDHSEQLQERQNVVEGLLHTMQSASEDEAMDILRRLRDGTDVFLIAEQVQAGRLLFNVGRPSAIDPSIIAEQKDRRSTLEMAHTAEQFDALILLIKTADFNLSTEVVRRIRQEEDVSSILHAATTGRLTAGPLLNRVEIAPQSIEADFALQEHTFGLVKGTGAGKQRADATPPNMAIPTAWTDVTDDADLIEHLVALWFTWQHSFFQNFPEKLFRADLAAGRSQYCSHSLVNAICAAACFLSNRTRVRVDQPEGQAMVTNFVNEAKQRLEDSNSSSLPSTAAFYIISYVEGTRGNPHNMWMLGGRSALMALELNLHLHYQSSPVRTQEQRQDLNDLKLARSHAFWGCFHLCQINSFTLGRLSILPANSITVELPHLDSEGDQEPWEAYETSLANRPGARNSTFHYCSTLSTTVNSTLMMFFAPNVPLTGALLVEEYHKYLRWYQNLPDILAHTQNSPPHVLCLGMYYHAAVLQLFRPFLKATIDNSDIVPRDVCRQAAQAISDLWTKHRELYGLYGILMFQIQCLLSACTIHIVDIPAIAATKHFTQACNNFQELLTWNGWAKSSLTLLRSLAEKWKLVLPREAEEALYRNVGSADMATTPEHQPQTTPWFVRTSEHSEQWKTEAPNTDPALSHSIERSGPANMPQTVGPTSQGYQDVSPAMQHGLRYHQSSAESEATQASTKRGSESETSNPPPHESYPKRQRTQSHQQRSSSSASRNLGRGTNLPPMQQPNIQGSAWQEQSPIQQVQVPVSSYLYSPVAPQQAPLLGPVHSSDASTFEQNPNDERAGVVQHTMWDETTGLQESVEGLTFGDDWRDPFMAFSPEQQLQEPEHQSQQQRKQI